MSIARSLIPIIAGLVTLTLAAACRQTPPPVPALRLTLDHPAELVIGGGPEDLFGLALASDGRRIVFPATGANTREGGSGGSSATQLWLRDLSTGTVQPLPGTENGVMPFWSPDDSTIGFFAGGRLRALTVADRSVRDLAEAPAPRGGVWHPNGDILFAPSATAPLLRRAADGTLQPLTTMEGGESSHRLPRLVDESYIVFFVRAAEPIRQGIWIAPLNAPASRKRLINSDAEGIPIDQSLVYASGSALVAQRIDLETLSLVGRPQLLGSPVGRGPEHQLFATGAGDMLLYGAPMSAQRELRWLDRAGTVTGIVGEPMNAWDVRLAPNGNRTAVARVDPQLNTLDIWVYDERRPLPRRLSPAIDADDSPAWSADGARLAWVSGRRTVTVRDSAGERPEQVVRKFDNVIRVTGWSPDNRWIVISESRPATNADVVLVPLAPGGEARMYAATPFNESYGTVSPSGRWLAYASDESGRSEIYVDTFPTPGRRARVTVGGGTEPRWRRDGSAIFFRRGREIHVARLEESGGTLESISSERLLDVGADVRAFDVAPDGERVIVNVPAPDAAPAPMTVLLHVRSLLPSAP